MDPAVLRAVETTAERLQHAGYRERDLGPGWPDGARAFRRADFRVQWVFTRLHTNVLLVPLDAVGGADVDRMTDAAVGWATRTKDGLPVGLQNGVAAMCVLVCGTPSDETVRRAEQPPRKRWSAIGLPVVVDAAAGSYGLY